MLRIESSTRWDALALTCKLARYHWFLPSDLEHRLIEWLDERGLEAATIHTETNDIVLTRP